MWRTYQRLKRIQPKLIVSQHTHPYASIVTAYYSSNNKHCRFILDCHNGPFIDTPWTLWPFKKINQALYRKAAINLVHNQGIGSYVTESLKLTGHFHILHDRIPEPSTHTIDQANNPNFVVPLSWSRDEPIELLIQAIKHCPNYTFHLTGKSRMKNLDLPNNALLAGYLEDIDFDRLLQQATGVIALSNRNHVLTRASQEALAYGKPLIISDTPTAREYYRAAAIYTENSKTSITAACHTLIANEKEISTHTKIRRSELLKEWDEELSKLEAELTRLETDALTE
jgi:glycosyltransferase involved in cell wall biosynthesis